MSAFHLYRKSGENFPPNGTVQFSSAFHLYENNSCSVLESNGTVLSSQRKEPSHLAAKSVQK